MSRNPVGPAADDDDFSEEIQDIASTQTDASRGNEEFLCVRTGKETKWLGVRRMDKELVQHRTCCFGINHCMYDGSHQLYVVDVVSSEEQPKEVVSGEAEAANGDELVQDDGGRMVVKRRRPQYFDKRQQLDLILEAQELAEFRDHELSPTESNDEEDQEMDARCIDIWKDAVCLGLLKEGVLSDAIDIEESKRAKKRVSNYCWKEQRLYFKGLLVPKPEERISLMSQMHEDLGHVEEQRTLAEIRRKYFWHHRTEDVKTVVRSCQQCQLVRSEGSIRSGDERLKSIPICDLFHRVALDTARPLPETKAGTKYILVAIDHYSKWCEAKAVVDHSAKTASKFLEDDIICRYGVPKFVLIDNGGEWAAEFEIMCENYGIQHQRTTPQWPQCNGIAERMIKTIKHGITVLVATPGNVDCWDEHLAKIMFGYRCGIQASTRFSPFMILIGRTPRLRVDNYLHALTAETDASADVEVTTAQFLQKMELIASIHKNVLLNVEQAQKQQKKTYATRKGKHLFKGLVAGVTMVKMKKPGKRRALALSWEGPYQFIGHTDGKGNLDFEEGCRMCII